MRALSLKSIGIPLLLAASIVPGCKTETEPTRKAEKYALSATPAAAAVITTALPPSVSTGVASPLDIVWEAPATWRLLPARSAMRKATYQIPRSPGDSEDAELAVFYFGAGQGGSIEANVDRWLKQFSGVKPDGVVREERKAGELPLHIVRIDSGKFSGGMPGGPAEPKDDWGLLGAIVETPSGPYFFKVTGPAATLKGMRETFYEMLRQVKFRQ